MFLLYLFCMKIFAQCIPSRLYANGCNVSTCVLVCQGNESFNINILCKSHFLGMDLKNFPFWLPHPEQERELAHQIVQAFEEQDLECRDD